MSVRVALVGLVLATTAVASGCTTDAHRASVPPSPTPSPRAVHGGEDSLAVVGAGIDPSAKSGVASFRVRNIDAGTIVVSSSARRQVRLRCPGSATFRVHVGDGSRVLTVLQTTGQVLLRTPIEAGGRWYVLARGFGGLISRERPASVGPASRGCTRS